MSLSGVALKPGSEHLHLAGERCPLCEQPIPNEKLLEIQARITAKERERSSEFERRTRELLLAERAQIEAKAKGELEEMKKQAEAAVAKANADAAHRERLTREQAKKAAEEALAHTVAEARQAKAASEQIVKEMQEALARAKTEATTREASVREEVRKATELAMTEKLSEVERAKTAAEQSAKIASEALAKKTQETAAREAALRDEVRKTTESAMAEKMAEVERAKSTAEQNAKTAAETAAKMAAEIASKEVAAREEAKKQAELAMAGKLLEAENAKKAAEQQIKEQREALEKAKTEAVNAEKAKHYEEKLKLDEKLEQVKRQLQQKTAQELGEGAEIDLYEALRAEFPKDEIVRVGKGLPGADIVHRIIHNGRECGCIVYDSKNRNAWRNEYVAKLRQDQLAEKADHAILASHVFPAGARQLHIQEGVIVANPARVVALVQILHRHVVQAHALRLSNEARQQKRDLLYEFITSDRCIQLLDQLESLTDNMLDLEVKEKKAHDTLWKRRGELLRSVQRARADFVAEIETIVGTARAESGESHESS